MKIMKIIMAISSKPAKAKLIANNSQPIAGGAIWRKLIAKAC
jgi:hypothetical protein